MAANSIAKANVLIAANADELRTGLSAAGNDVQKWGNDLGKKAGANASGGMFGMIGKAGPYAVAAGVAIGGVALGLAKVSETLNDISAQGDIAQAIGLTAEQFTGMAGVAKSVGEDTREFIESLVTMGKLGTDAAKGTEAAADAFKIMGLDANNFIKLRADEQFMQIFDALSRVQDPLQKTRALMAAFGEDGGKYLLPLLKKTPAELQKMAAGFAINSEEMKKSQAASQALKSVEMNLGKLWRTAAIGFAPLIEGLSNFATRAIEFVRPFFNWWLRYWDAITEVAIPFFDMVGDAASGLWSDIKSGFADAFGWVGELPTIRDVVIGVVRGVGTGFAVLWDLIKSGAGVVGVALGAVAGGFGIIMKEIPGMEDIGARMERTGDKMVNWGAKAMQGFGNSAVDWNNWLDKAMAPKVKTVDVAIKPGAGLNTDDLKSDPVKLAGLFTKGSAEAYSLVLRNQFGIKEGDTAKRAAKAAEKNVKVNEKNGDKLDNIADAFKGLGAI